mgnify:CR=1 FL=1
MKTNEEIKITRNDLYKAVWSQTFKAIAEEYNVKPRAIRLACDTLNIPTPPPGHWRKVLAGRPPEAIPLPTLNENQPTEFSFLLYVIENVDKGTATTRLITPRKTHEIIKLNKELYRDYKVQDRGIISPINKGEAIPIFVTKSSVNRALAIMNTIFWQFDSKGWAFRKSKDNSMCLEVIVDDEHIDFSLKETTKRIDHVLSKSELSKQKRGEHVWHERYDYLPSGKLTLLIENWLPYGSKKQYKDGKLTLVEDQLSSFINQLENAAIYKKETRIRRAEEERLRSLEIERRQYLKLKRENEIQRRNQLIEDAENWKKADLIRQYIKNSSANDLEWAEWATNYADLLDPQTTGEDTVVEDTEGMNLDSRYY